MATSPLFRALDQISKIIESEPKDIDPIKPKSISQISLDSIKSCPSQSTSGERSSTTSIQSTSSKTSIDSTNDDNKKKMMRCLMEFKRYMSKDSSNNPMCKWSLVKY